MTWNCPNCFRANSKKHTECRGCGKVNPSLSVPEPKPQSSRPKNNPSPNPHPESHPVELSEAEKWQAGMQNHQVITGEVLSITEATIPQPLDQYRVLSMVILIGVFGFLALPMVIGLVAGAVIVGMMLSFTGMVPKAGAHGCSPFLLHMMLLRGSRGPKDQIPRLGIRLRDESGQVFDTIALGHVEWPTPAVGDRLVLAGSTKNGVFQICKGRNLTTGAEINVPGTKWRYVFFILLGLMGLFTVGFGLLYLFEGGLQG